MKLKIFQNLLVIFCLIILGSSCIFAEQKENSMLISTKSFENNGFIAKNQAYKMCGGDNISPDLSWSDVPNNTKSFAIVCHDPDAPVAGGWYHWVLINIPLSQNKLEKGEIPQESHLLQNDFGEFAYGGPCPPIGHGIHHYNFTVYALDVENLDIADNISAKDAHKIIKEHAISSATVTGLFKR